MEKPTYTVIVVGPGAIGCLFGGILRESGQEVVLLDHDVARAKKIDQDGIHLEGVSGARTIKVRATARPADLPNADLVIIATKSYDTGKAVRDVAGAVGADTAVLTLQNGLGNVELIMGVVGAERTIGGITSQGANVVGPGSVIHAGTGKTVIGTPANRPTEYLEKAKAILEAGRFDPQISYDLEGTIWSKLVINVGINALTAILRINNGRLLEFEGSREVMRQAVKEAVAIAQAKRVKLLYPDPLAQVEEVCRLTAKNVASMLQDALAKRRTEIDAINGAIVRLGAEVGIATPVNATLASLVRVIERSYNIRINR